MKIGLFPGQEQALREHYAQLRMLARRRFLYLFLGLASGAAGGLFAGLRMRPHGLSKDSGEHDDELPQGHEISTGPSSQLRSKALFVIAKFQEYPSDPILYTGLVRLAELIVAEPPSPERRVLAVFVKKALELSPNFP